MNYIAFLRGINLGPTHKVPMKDLQTCFFDLGFTNVKTLLNSGNIFFATDETNIARAFSLFPLTWAMGAIVGCECHRVSVQLSG